MALRKFIFVLLGLCPRVLWPADPPTPLTLAVVVNQSNPLEQLSSVQLRKILLGETTQWRWAGQAPQRVTLVRQIPESEVSREVLRQILRRSEAEYRRHWVQLEYQGGSITLLKTLNSPANAIKFVLNVPGSIALVDSATAKAWQASVKVLRINGRMPDEPGYRLE